MIYYLRLKIKYLDRKDYDGDSSFCKRNQSEAEIVRTRRLPQKRISLPNRKPKALMQVGFDGARRYRAHKDRVMVVVLSVPCPVRGGDFLFVDYVSKNTRRN